MDGLAYTGWQWRRLERQLREAEDVPLYRRTLALLEVARGRSVAEVARALGVSRQSIYNWAAAYSADYDPLALADGAHRNGSTPTSATSSLKEKIGAVTQRLLELSERTTQIGSMSRTVEDLNAVTFADTLHGWAVGTFTILHTSDGGRTWISQLLNADVRAAQYEKDLNENAIFRLEIHPREGEVAEPTTPVTRGVERTMCQVFSSRSISTST